MEDASHKQLTLDHMLSGSVKRLAFPRVGGDKRLHQEQQEDVSGRLFPDPVITPTPSNENFSSSDFSDLEIPSEGSHLSLQREQSTVTVVDAKQMEKEKLKVALKLDRQKDKLSRYESHVTFLRKCLENDIIPNGLRTYVEPSIGNRDDVFLEGWHGILFECSKKLINHSIDFSVNVIETMKTEIKATEDQLKTLVTGPAYEKVEASLKKNDEIRIKDLTSRKNRKFYRLKYGEKERDDRQPPSNNRNNEILNNRGQRGLGQPRRPVTNNFDNRHDNERSRWNDRQPVANNNNTYTRNTNDDQSQQRIIEVIESRNNNQATERRNNNQATTSRGPRATTKNEPPIHERVALSRKNSRRNLAHNDVSPREDFPPLSRETRENPQRTNRMDDAGRERSRNNEIEALRKRIDALQRERTNSTNHQIIENLDDASKNGDGAQGPSSRPTNDTDMRTYIKSALEIICGYAERLDQQSGSEMTRSETL